MAEISNTTEQPAKEETLAGSPALPCSPSLLTPDTDAYLAQISEKRATWTTADEWAHAGQLMTNHARRLEIERDNIAKEADNARMNAEETVHRLRLKVVELLKHKMDSNEYTDGWEDALLKVQTFLENEIAQTRAQLK